MVAGSLVARSWALRGLLHVLVGTLALTKGPGWQYTGGGGAGVMSPYLDAGMLYEMPAFAIIVAGALYLLANACCLNVLYARRVARARIRRAHEQGMLEKLYVEREDDDAGHCGMAEMHAKRESHGHRAETREHLGVT